MRRPAIYLSCSSAERAEFWCAWRWLLIARLGLTLFGVTRSLRWLPAPVSANGIEDVIVAQRAVAWTKIAAHYVPGAVGCLPSSLALAAQLRRRGIPCELRIGAQPADGTLKAHAWVELGGRPINDAADVSMQFPPFGTTEPASAS